MKLVLIEDQRMVSDSLCASIQARMQMEWIAVYPSCSEALSNPDVLNEADVALVDIHLGAERAFDHVAAIRRVAPKLRLLIVTSVTSEYDLHRIVAAEFDGFVHKNDPIEVLITAIERVAAGNRFSSESVTKLLKSVRGDANHFDKILSVREQELLALLGQGLSNAEVGALLGLSPSTVKVHRKNIMGKLDLHSGSDLVAYAIRSGFVLSAQLPRAGQR